jgi:transposase-like protein
MRDRCKSCGQPWDNHLGVEGTCRKLEKAKSALRVIVTWASFRQNGDYPAFDREDVLALAKKTLEEIEGVKR